MMRRRRVWWWWWWWWWWPTIAWCWWWHDTFSDCGTFWTTWRNASSLVHARKSILWAFFEASQICLVWIFSKFPLIMLMPCYFLCLRLQAPEALCFRVVRPSVLPSVHLEGFPGISRKLHGGNGLQFCMLMYPDHLQNWLDFGHGLLIFLLLARLWFSEIGQMWGFRAFPGERMEGMACNLACWCILTTFQSDEILIMVCWFSSFWCHFDLVKRAKFGISGHFPENAWREQPAIWHAGVSWPPSILIRCWSWSVDFPAFGATLTLWNGSHLGFLGIFWRMHTSKCLGGAEAYFRHFAWMSSWYWSLFATVPFIDIVWNINRTLEFGWHSL